jgi:hypothetical protein
MREEALNTNDNYYQRDWLTDKKTTLRYQPVIFIESGLLSNEVKVASSSESEDEDGQSSPTHEQDTPFPLESGSAVEKDSPLVSLGDEPDATITTPLVEDSISASSIETKPSIVPPAILPQSTPIEDDIREDIVFIPRNQRNKSNIHTPLSNWETPFTFKGMGESSSPDWTKPKKKRNGKRGHKKYRQAAKNGAEQTEIVVEATMTDEDALNDYLENIRAQESDGLDRTLEAEDVVEHALESLSLEDTMIEEGTRSKSIVTTPPSDARIIVPSLPESAAPIAVSPPESIRPMASLTNPDSDIETNKIGHESVFVGNGVVIANNLLLESDDDELEDDDDDADEEEESDEEDDDDEDLDEDDEIIANMIFDDYDLDDLNFDAPKTQFQKKSITRQPNVPELPSEDDDIGSHLLDLWKRDRETKKAAKQDREKARLLGLLGHKSKSKTKNLKKEARSEELSRILTFDAVDFDKLNQQIRTFWEDDESLE